MLSSQQQLPLAALTLVFWLLAALATHTASAIIAIGTAVNWRRKAACTITTQVRTVPSYRRGAQENGSAVVYSYIKIRSVGTCIADVVLLEIELVGYAYQGALVQPGPPGARPLDGILPPTSSLPRAAAPRAAAAPAAADRDRSAARAGWRRVGRRAGPAPAGPRGRPRANARA